MNRTVLIVGALVVTPLLIFLALSFQSDPRAIESPLVGRPAPDFTLQGMDGNVVRLSDLRGQPVVLNFWATWCQPCIKSIPLLNEMSDDFGNLGVNFIGVSVDGPRNQSKIKPIIQSMGIGYPIIRDMDSELMSELGVTAVPTLLVYDSEGELLFYHEGFRPGDEEILRKSIEEHLAE